MAPSSVPPQEPVESGSGACQRRTQADHALDVGQLGQRGHLALVPERRHAQQLLLGRAAELLQRLRGPAGSQHVPGDQLRGRWGCLAQLAACILPALSAGSQTAAHSCILLMTWAQAQACSPVAHSWVHMHARRAAPWQPGLPLPPAAVMTTRTNAPLVVTQSCGRVQAAMGQPRAACRHGTALRCFSAVEPSRISVWHHQRSGTHLLWVWQHAGRAGGPSLWRGRGCAPVHAARSGVRIGCRPVSLCDLLHQAGLRGCILGLPESQGSQGT